MLARSNLVKAISDVSGTTKALKALFKSSAPNYQILTSDDMGNSYEGALTNTASTNTATVRTITQTTQNSYSDSVSNQTVVDTHRNSFRWVQREISTKASNKDKKRTIAIVL